MSNSGRGARFWLSAWLPVTLMITAIAIESTPWLGSDHTSGPLRSMWEFVFGRVTDAAWEPIHHAIRKTGHFVGYGLLGLGWLRAWKATLGGSFLRNAALALAGTALVASADEWHQTMLPNRTGRWQDVVIDTSGAVTLLALAGILHWMNASSKKLPRAA